MFDLGFSEIMLIFVIGLIVVGPNRLPKLARTAGFWIGKARSMVSSVKSEVERELRVEELKKSIKEQAPIDDLKDVAKDVRSLGAEMQSIGKDVKSSAEKLGRMDGEKSATAASAAGPKQSAEEDAAKPVNTMTKPAAAMAHAPEQPPAATPEDVTQRPTSASTGAPTTPKAEPTETAGPTTQSRTVSE